ncbi:MAG: hypothetical protein FJY98_03445 [Candidatus Liptonbacteria bacterium]|nr:hypothetical protein [Candidatus Liptonbacteria bacterium]
MVCLLIVGGAMLVFAYTRFNDTELSLRIAKENFQKQQAENARLKGELLSLFDATNLATFAGERSLVLEKKPSYIEVDRNSQWHFASGR